MQPAKRMALGKMLVNFPAFRVTALCTSFVKRPLPMHPAGRMKSRSKEKQTLLWALVFDQGQFSPQGTFYEMSRDILGCHNWGGATTSG